MELSFQNFYAFEFTLGLVTIISGFYLFSLSLYFIIMVVVGWYLIFDSVIRWNKSQRKKES